MDVVGRDKMLRMTEISVSFIVFGKVEMNNNISNFIKIQKYNLITPLKWVKNR